jgi:hypothetical protein
MLNGGKGGGGGGVCVQEEFVKGCDNSIGFTLWPGPRKSGGRCPEQCQ